MPARLPALLYEPLIDLALREDLGAGDVTGMACVPPEAEARAMLIAKEPLVLCGVEVACAVFRRLDPAVRIEVLHRDGERLAKGEAVLQVSGRARALLAAERTALNFLQHLSGIATLTARYVAEIAHTKARLVDTRKTQPGQRALEKAAVRVGGGGNHRTGLADGVLIKENHIRAAGSIAQAVSACRRFAPHTLAIEVEVTNLDEFDQALAAGADIIMLDNFALADVRRAVEKGQGRVRLEVSGNLSLDTIRVVAETGVDLLSVGKLTHSAPAADLSLLFDSRA